MSFVHTRFDPSLCLDHYDRLLADRVNEISTGLAALDGGTVVDLGSLGVVADVETLAVRQANTAAIASAIATYSGSGYGLLLPRGRVHVEELAGNHCVKFGTGVSDLELVGYGPRATTLVQNSVGDGGEQNLIVVDGASNISFRDFGLEQSYIGVPDAGQQNHLLCIYNNTLGGTTRHIRGCNLRFGKCIGDALRLLANDASDAVEDIWFDFIEMVLNGTVTSDTPNGRTGARSGIAVQRGATRFTLSNFAIVGAQNSAIDEEPSGGASYDGWYLNGRVDNRSSNTGTPVSLGGSGGGDLAYNGRFENVKVLGGKVTMLGGTSGYALRNVEIETTEAMPADATEGLLLIRSGSAGHDELVLENVTIKRTGTSGAGPCLDIINTGTKTTIKNLRVEQGTNAYPVQMEHNGRLEVRGYRCKFSGATPASYRALDVIPVASGGTLAVADIEDVSASTASGSLHSAVSIQSRTSRTVTRVRVANVSCAGFATTGLYLSCTAGTCDLYPEISGIDNVGGTAMAFTDEGDAPVTTFIPQIGGSRGSVADFWGTGAPSFSAALGSTYRRIDGGASTSFYVNTDGGTTWTAK